MLKTSHLNNVVLQLTFEGKFVKTKEKAFREAAENDSYETSDSSETCSTGSKAICMKGEKRIKIKGNSKRTYPVDPVIDSVLSVSIPLTHEECFSNFLSPSPQTSNDKKLFNTSGGLAALINTLAKDLDVELSGMEFIEEVPKAISELNAEELDDPAWELACSEPGALDPEIDKSNFVYSRFVTGSVALAKYRKKLEAAIAEAKKALQLSVEERIFNYRSMNSDFIDAALIEIGSQSPRTLYDRYIASRKCRKLVPASKGTLSQLLMNIDTIGPQLCQLFKETIIKVLGEHQARSKPTISIDRKGRLTCSKPRVSKKRSKRYSSRNDDTSRRSNEDFEHLETWIECTRCKKWRFVADIYDISDVSRKWHCGLQTKWKADSASLGNGNPCDEEEDVAGKERFHAQPQVYSEFTAGSIVWAKIRGAS
ncbi:hypothetical protein Aperf_G00000023497 [Anoplocephala perfoliata]